MAGVKILGKIYRTILWQATKHHDVPSLPIGGQHAKCQTMSEPNPQAVCSEGAAQESSPKSKR